MNKFVNYEIDLSAIEHRVVGIDENGRESVIANFENAEDAESFLNQRINELKK
jgi:hypothetical protein